MDTEKNNYYCKINGTAYNLEGLAAYLNKENFGTFLLKLSREHGINIIVANCFCRYVEDAGFVIPSEWNSGMAYPGSETWKMQQEVKEMKKQLVKCPTCGYQSGRKLRYLEKTWLSGTLDKTFKCEHCGYTW